MRSALAITIAPSVGPNSSRAVSRQRQSQRSNIGGVILGGLSENLSLVVGFNNLLLVAIAYYALSAAFRPRGRA